MSTVNNVDVLTVRAAGAESHRVKFEVFPEPMVSIASSSHMDAPAQAQATTQSAHSDLLSFASGLFSTITPSQSTSINGFGRDTMSGTSGRRFDFSVSVLADCLMGE